VENGLREGITLAADPALPATLPAPAAAVRTPHGKTGEFWRTPSHPSRLIIA
jgi:hypothetical protein